MISSTITIECKPSLEHLNNPVISFRNRHCVDISNHPRGDVHPWIKFRDSAIYRCAKEIHRTLPGDCKEPEIISRYRAEYRQRYGKDDQLGFLNRLTNDVVVEASKEIRSGNR